MRIQGYPPDSKDRKVDTGSRSEVFGSASSRRVSVDNAEPRNANPKDSVERKKRPNDSPQSGGKLTVRASGIACVVLAGLSSTANGQGG
jgi:hypothetical protein